MKNVAHSSLGKISEYENNTVITVIQRKSLLKRDKGRCNRENR